MEFERNMKLLIVYRYQKYRIAVNTMFPINNNIHIYRKGIEI